MSTGTEIAVIMEAVIVALIGVYFVLLWCLIHRRQKLRRDEEEEARDERELRDYGIQMSARVASKSSSLVKVTPGDDVLEYDTVNDKQQEAI